MCTLIENQKLLIKDKKKRLGATNDAEEILKHKFFKIQ
jgi:hypothetical protein